MAFKQAIPLLHTLHKWWGGLDGVSGDDRVKSSPETTSSLPHSNWLFRT
jgi:hypothetical protein